MSIGTGIPYNGCFVDSGMKCMRKQTGQPQYSSLMITRSNWPMFTACTSQIILQLGYFFHL
jgi:hypothetical protein